MKPLDPHLDPHLENDQFTLLYFGEGPEISQAPARLHLAHCEVCRREYEELSHFLNALHDVPLPEPGVDWERNLWAAIVPRVAPVLERRRAVPLRRWWFAAPALAALLVAAFLAGKYTGRPSNQPRTFSAQARERVLLITLGEHLDRSQVVLAELVNAPVDESLDISGEQSLAGQLVGENRLLRQTALRSGDVAHAALLDQLERVLLDVEHAPAEVSPRELNNLRERIEGQGLLFKVRVISANAREKGMKL